MKICAQCAKQNPASAIFCQECGKSLAQQPPSLSGVQTVRYAGPLLGERAAPRTTPLAVLFAGKDRLRVGRASDCDVCLAHPMVSRHHALLERLSDGRLRLTDLESSNGITVNGVRITQPTIVGDNVSIGIGPFLFTPRHGQLNTVDSSRS